MKESRHTMLQAALRRMEAAHAKWMNTSKFAPNADQVAQEKDEAISRYIRIRNGIVRLAK